MQYSNRSKVPSGFTLVEMLVVITIIGILVALLIPAVGVVTKSVKNSTLALEVQKLADAIEAYKAKTGDYPPDFTYQTAVVNHVRKAYPRNSTDIVSWLSNPIPSTSLHPANLDPAEALVFWLSMTKNNPRAPLGNDGEPVIFFEFEPSLLRDIDNDGWPEYYPKNANEAPFVYFDGRVISVQDSSSASGRLQTYAYAYTVYPSPYSDSNLPPVEPARPLARAGSSIPNPSPGPFGIVRPYRSNTVAPATDTKTWQGLTAANTTTWMNPGAFQIICAGLDNHFGNADPNPVFKSFPEPNYYSDNSPRTADEDNIANFSEMKTLGDSVP